MHYCKTWSWTLLWKNLATIWSSDRYALPTKAGWSFVNSRGYLFGANGGVSLVKLNIFLCILSTCKNEQSVLADDRRVYCIHVPISKIFLWCESARLAVLSKKKHDRSLTQFLCWCYSWRKNDFQLQPMVCRLYSSYCSNWRWLRDLRLFYNTSKSKKYAMESVVKKSKTVQVKIISFFKNEQSF